MTAPDLRQPALPPRIDALVCRLAGGLASLAGAVMLVVAIVVSRLPKANGPDGFPVYAIPGTHHALETTVVPLLASIGVVAAAIGLLVMAIGHVPRQIGGRATTASRVDAGRPLIKRQTAILVLGVASLATVLWLKR